LIDHVKRCLAILTTFAALALLAGCATSKLVSQKANPDYVGKKSFKTVMVVAVTADEMVRRPFEDRMVAHLAKRGVKGIPGYAAVAKRGKVEEAELKEAIARSGADGVLITRITGMDRSSVNLAESTVAVGYGWGSFYGYYSGVWTTVSTPAQTVSGPTWTVSETRLFDAKSGTLAWTGIMDSKETNKLDAALTQYIEVVFDAMVGDRVL
jgi:hypothetical protein